MKKETVKTLFVNSLVIVVILTLTDILVPLGKGETSLLALGLGVIFIVMRD